MACESTAAGARAASATVAPGGALFHPEHPVQWHVRDADLSRRHGRERHRGVDHDAADRRHAGPAGAQQQVTEQRLERLEAVALHRLVVRPQRARWVIEGQPVLGARGALHRAGLAGERSVGILPSRPRFVRPPALGVLGIKLGETPKREAPVAVLAAE